MLIITVRKLSILLLVILILLKLRYVKESSSLILLNNVQIKYEQLLKEERFTRVL